MHVVLLGQALIEHDLRAYPYPEYAPLRERLSGADVVFSDLETALIPDVPAAATRSGTYFHSARPEVLDCLRDLSVNLLTLANNHSHDLGEAGIAAAIADCRRRVIGHAGTGATLEAASAPGYVQTPSGRAGLVAFASKVPDAALAQTGRAGVNHLCLQASRRVVEGDRRRVLDAIGNAARSARVVIACQHDHYWEPDWHLTPDWKRDFARECIDAGAHAYVSHGVPLLHGIEIYRGRPIFYGLGCFIFHTHTDVGHYEPAVWESVAAHCQYEDNRLTTLRLEPIALNERGDPDAPFLITRGRPRLAQGSQARAILQRLRELSAPYGTQIELCDGHGRVRCS